MSKEHIFNYNLYSNSNILERIMNIKINDGTLEKYIKINNKINKIDLFFNAVGDRKIYIETQLTEADWRHLEKINKLIDLADNGDYVLWIAKKFNYLMKKVEQKIMDIKKDIKFYFMEIDGTSLKVNKVINSLDKRDKKMELEILQHYIKKEFKDNYLFHFNRKINNNTIFYGAGETDITYTVRILKNNDIKIALNFYGNKRNVYKSTFINREKVIKIYNENITFNNDKTNIIINIKNNNNELDINKLEEIAIIFKEFYKIMDKRIKSRCS